MNISNLFRWLVFALILGSANTAWAATVSWGALTTNAVADCDEAGNCDIDSVADADGGSMNASASSSISDPRGNSNASATLSGTSLTPTLSVFAESLTDPAQDPSLVQATASGIQAYTNLDIARTITLDLALTTAPIVGSFPGTAVIGNVVVFKPGAPELTFEGDDILDIPLDPLLDSAIGAPSVFASSLFSSTSASFTFDVAAGESFLIWALLVAQAENGGLADASNTLVTKLFEGDPINGLGAELGSDELLIASQDVGVIPLPAGAWLFLTGVTLIAGLSRRRKGLPAS